jgi:hypothetical protein
MASALYPKWKEAIIQASSNSSLTGTVKAILIDAGTYTYSAAHDFFDDVSGTGGTAQTIGTKTYTSGVFDGDDVTFTAVAGTVSYEAVLIYIDTGVAGTSRLVAYIDQASSGLPVTSNGGDITVTWDAGASKIFAL